MLEDSGFSLWSDIKNFTKDDLMNKAGMPTRTAEAVAVVLKGDAAERPDLLRGFQLPDFADLLDLFEQRFPAAGSGGAGEAREFARALTDELGVASLSFLQVGFGVQLHPMTKSRPRYLV